MKIYNLNSLSKKTNAKNAKKVAQVAQVAQNATHEPVSTYTVRSMLKDLDKWEQFVETMDLEDSGNSDTAI